MYINTFTLNNLTKWVMIMTTVLDLQQKVISILESNLNDPNPNRESLNKKWIYDDIPRMDLSSNRYPRVSIVPQTIDSEPHSLNDTRDRLTVRLAVQIRLNKSSKILTSSGQKRDNELIEEIAFDIITILRDTDSREQFNTSVCAFYFQLESESLTEVGNILIKQLVYRVLMVR